jgi:cytoskeletal protein RodZ
MDTLGKYIKKERSAKKYSLEKLADETKIRKEFLQAIESDNWDKLPDYSVVRGFIRNISSTLGVGEDLLLALLRRDFPSQKSDPNPKPDVVEKFVWSPKLTFSTLTILGSLLLIIYLTFQYMNFIKPPKLVVDLPQEKQVVEGRFVTVSGTTDIGSTVKVNNQPVLIEKDGTFKVELEISSTTMEVVIIARSRSGSESIVVRDIFPK